jgi:hypothetical protein
MDATMEVNLWAKRGLSKLNFESLKSDYFFTTSSRQENAQHANTSRDPFLAPKAYSITASMPSTISRSSYEGLIRAQLGINQKLGHLRE